MKTINILCIFIENLYQIMMTTESKITDNVKQDIYPVPQNVLDLIHNHAKVISIKDVQLIFNVSNQTASDRFRKCKKALGKSISDCITIYQYYSFYQL